MVPGACCGERRPWGGTLPPQSRAKQRHLTYSFLSVSVQTGLLKKEKRLKNAKTQTWKSPSSTPRAAIANVSLIFTAVIGVPAGHPGRCCHLACRWGRASGSLGGGWTEVPQKKQVTFFADKCDFLSPSVALGRVPSPVKQVGKHHSPALRSGGHREDRVLGVVCERGCSWAR